MDPKLLLVLAPIVLTALAVAVAAWRGRLPSRPVLNALFSVLLLAYLLATAGLGIFWVAYQHLPVFDWHYLFGYCLLVLVLVHLGFNLRMLWHQLRHGGRRPVAAVGQEGRRGWVAAAVFGAPALLALGYWIGLRHGRTELRVVAGGAAGSAGTRPDLALVEAFHEFSSHSRQSAFRRAASVDWGGQPEPFKRYPQQPQQAAPAWLAQLLWHVTGVNERRGGIRFRTSPSSGALFATELYMWSGSHGPLRRGWWHHDAETGQLASLGAAEAGLATLGSAATAPLLVLASAVFRRSGHKYGDRTYRYVLADLGHALENLRQAAAELGWRATLLPRFDEAALARDLGLDEAEEGVLALVALTPLNAAPAPASRGLAETAPPVIALPVSPPATTLTAGRALGVTDAMHQASSWRAPWAAAASASAAASIPSAASSAVALPTASASPSKAIADWPLPAATPSTGDVLARIARRRSQRRYATTALSATALAALLRATQAATPQLSEAVRIHVLTQAVQGLATTSWWYDPAADRLRPMATHAADAVRERSRAAGLDQDVIGDAAALFVLTLHRPTLAADPAGAARGYRHAFLEAGLIGERLYLEAVAQRLAICAVGAFYDDQAAALIGVDPREQWVLHFAAVGVPA